MREQAQPEQLEDVTKNLSRWPARVGAGLAVVLVALFIGLLAYGIAAQSINNTIDGRLAQGRSAPAPAFDLAILQRGQPGSGLQRALTRAFSTGRLTTRELRGTAVLLNIWASWCEPCRQEAPRLEHAWRNLGRPHHVLFVGLDQQDATNDALAFLHTYGIDYPSVHDPGGDVPRSYGATGVPETFFISSSGQIVDHVIGVIDVKQLRDGLAAAQTGRPVGVRSGGARRRTK